MHYEPVQSPSNLVHVTFVRRTGRLFIGEYVEKQILLEADNTAFQNSGQVENEVKTLNPYQRCIALGGVPNECKVFMRGLDKAAQSP